MKCNTVKGWCVKINPSLNYIITEIKSKIDILTVVEESNLHLSKRGRNYMGLCLFHSEKTASFSVNPQKNIFKCFGCGVSGDQINLYALLHNIDNGQAIYQLSQRIGLTGSKLTKQQKIVISKRQDDQKLEKKFEQEYRQLFDYLCNLRNFMKSKAEKHKEMGQVEQDSLLIRYYLFDAGVAAVCRVDELDLPLGHLRVGGEQRFEDRLCGHRPRSDQGHGTG